MTAWIERGASAVRELLDANPGVETIGPDGAITMISAAVDSARLRDVIALRGIRDFIRAFGTSTNQSEVGVVVGDDYLGICDFEDAL